ncbi:Hypothetical predicted protein [Paramuricea clavata]|uniref:Uncharacterized protein n=1 Tax=Paramuricea clavata TaxID=317549 RepID=A0A6S7IY33_PARCT|nr:Hypothetical predicted protein [Paramuricea clavata]
MAMPKSQEVIAFLVDKLSSKKHYTWPYFVGLRKIDEEWEWIDDTPLSRGLSDKIESNFHSCAVIQEGSLRKMPCNFKAGYICEMKTGIEASRVLTVGDSLTKGYFHGGKRFHPYGAKLEVLLNKDDHRCFVVEISGKNGEQSDNMLQRLSHYLNTRIRKTLVTGSVPTENLPDKSHEAPKRERRPLVKKGDTAVVDHSSTSSQPEPQYSDIDDTDTDF